MQHKTMNSVSKRWSYSQSFSTVKSYGQTLNKSSLSLPLFGSTISLHVHTDTYTCREAATK